MFAGTKRRSSNVRVMQIFHELKAQFPTIPDHILTSCITSYVSSNSKENLYDLLAIHQNQMGRASLQLETTPFVPTPTTEHHPIELEEATTPDSEGSRGDFERLRIGDMNKSVSDNNHNIVKKSDAHSDNKIALKRADSVTAKRPNTLNIKPGANDKERKLQLSGKCPDVHKLLNSPILADKPPRSPVSAKRFSVKTPSKKPDTPASSPTSILPLKKETVSTPTQTTDTLVNKAVSPSVNLSLNVNCQMGLVQSPTTKPKCTAKVELTPTQPWLGSNPFLNDPATSPRSFTSVNLTLRPPSAIPQDPIDITSQNSSLTYSTSSFDKQKGLQSRLQITVGPGNASSVSSIRTRPKSFHMAESPTETAPARAGSLNDLAVVTSEPPTLFKQQARIDRMRIELTTANAKLVILRQEVNELERNTLQVARRKTEEELEKQLKLEIKHMTVQCEQLAELFADKEFYNNIYTGPTGPLLTLPSSTQFSRRPPSRRPPTNRLLYQAPALPFQEAEDPKWNCSVCTFLNHPDLDKCEQCEMPRIYHGRSNPSLTLDALRNIPNPADFDVDFDMFRKSASALQKTVDRQPATSLLRLSNSMPAGEMIRRLQLNNNNNSSKDNNRFPVVPSVSAPSVIAFSANQDVNSSSDA